MEIKRPLLRVILADDHPLFREGLRQTLSLDPSIHVLATLEDGQAALEAIRSQLPDVAILDINMPLVNGLQVASQVQQEKLPTRVILLTGYNDTSQALHAAVAGARGFCSKDVLPETLLRCVHAVAEGSYVLGEEIFTQEAFRQWVQTRFQWYRGEGDNGQIFKPLSAREMEVLACMARGMSNKEIAAKLFISQQTVKNHVTSILRKFGVEDRTQAVVYALKHGWIDLQDLEV